MWNTVTRIAVSHKGPDRVINLPLGERRVRDSSLDDAVVSLVLMLVIIGFVAYLTVTRVEIDLEPDQEQGEHPDVLALARSITGSKNQSPVRRNRELGTSAHPRSAAQQRRCMSGLPGTGSLSHGARSSRRRYAWQEVRPILGSTIEAGIRAATWHWTTHDSAIERTVDREAPHHCLKAAPIIELHGYSPFLDMLL